MLNNRNNPMNENIKDVVFSDSIIQFVSIGNQFIIFVESASQLDRQAFITEALKLTTLLYSQALNLPTLERINDEPNTKFVTEFDWVFVRNGIQSILGDDDFFFDNYDLEMNELPEPITYNISEFIADIYQDLKDFIEIYKLGDEILSYNAIVDCYDNFLNYWGIRAAHLIKILHYLKFIKTIEENKNLTCLKRNTDEWIISKAQKNYRNPQ